MHSPFNMRLEADFHRQPPKYSLGPSTVPTRHYSVMPSASLSSPVQRWRNHLRAAGSFIVEFGFPLSRSARIIFRFSDRGARSPPSLRLCHCLIVFFCLPSTCRSHLLLFFADMCCVMFACVSFFHCFCALPHILAYASVCRPIRCAASGFRNLSTAFSPKGGPHCGSGHWFRPADLQCTVNHTYRTHLVRGCAMRPLKICELQLAQGESQFRHWRFWDVSGFSVCILYEFMQVDKKWRSPFTRRLVSEYTRIVHELQYFLSHHRRRIQLLPWTLRPQHSEHKDRD